MSFGDGRRARRLFGPLALAHFLVCLLAELRVLGEQLLEGPGVDVDALNVLLLLVKLSNAGGGESSALIAVLDLPSAEQRGKWKDGERTSEAHDAEKGP